MAKKRTRPTSRQQALVPRKTASVRARAPLSKLSPQQRGAITRAARKAGKDPARVFAGLKAADTRRKAERDAQRRIRQRETETRRQPRSKKTQQPDDRRSGGPAKSRKRVARKRPTGRKRSAKRPAKKPSRRTPAQRSEYAVSADYRAGRKGSAVTIQIAAIGPKGASKDDAIDAVNHKIDTNHSPAGWKIRIINWRGGEWRGEPVINDKNKADAWHTLSAPLALADLDVSKVGRDET